MPLPNDPTMVFPPATEAKYRLKYQEWAAWYSGEPQYIADFYGGTAIVQQQSVHTPWWKFWSRVGKSQYNVTAKSMLHVPIPGDLNAVSSSLLFGEEPRVVIPEAHEQRSPTGAKTLEERLKEIIEKSGMHNLLIEAGETASAMSGVYLKPSWDQDLMPHPYLSVAQVDQAVPIFRGRFLREVTFWREVGRDGHRVMRHLEWHGVVNGRATIEHGLYVGSEGVLGERRSLDSHPDTLGLEQFVELPFDHLDVKYVPNMRPNRLWRNSPLGLSDYSGSETLFDALDETYASWMRDIRLGKARIIVPDDYLNDQQKFDVDHEVFTRLQMPPQMKEGGSRIEAHQFTIRYQEHLSTSLELVERIVSNAGYSPQSFGIRIEGRAESGTALRVRENKTFLTMRRKGHWWRPALEEAMWDLLEIDRVIFGTQGLDTNFRPSVDLSDSLQQGIEELAGTANLLKQAQSASIETRVKMIHPEWTQEQVDAEVEKIKEEEGVGALAVPEFGGTPPGTPEAGAEEEGEARETEQGEEGQSS